MKEERTFEVFKNIYAIFYLTPSLSLSLYLLFWNQLYDDVFARVGIGDLNTKSHGWRSDSDPNTCDISAIR